MSSISITHNPATQRFETQVDGVTAYVSYEHIEGGLAYTHTIVPEAIGGRGIASQLAKHVLDYALEHKLRVEPACSFIRSYIAKNAKYQVLTA